MGSQGADGSRGPRLGRNTWGKGRAGIYAITHVATGRRYIGQSGQVERRWTLHRCSLRGDRHRNRHLQAAWNKYGEDAFTFTILEEVTDTSLLDEREQFWLDATTDKFNLRPLAESNRGVRMPEEARARQIGRRHSPETIAKMRARKPSVETRQKMSAARKGQRWSDETYRRMGEARRGFRHSAATIAKMSVAKRPPPTPASPAVRARVADEKAHNFLLVSPDRSFFCARNLRAACRLLALDQSAMLRVSAGVQIQHKGWVCFRITSPMENGIADWLQNGALYNPLHLTEAHRERHAGLLQTLARGVYTQLLTESAHSDALRQANARPRRRPGAANMP